MIFCLHCFSLSPSGSIFCQSCGRSFGARLCGAKKRHRNHPSAQVCSQCGSKNLTDATPYLPLGCITWLISWAGVLLLLKWLWPTICRVAAWSVGVVLNLVPDVIEYCAHWLVVVVILYWLLSFIPGEVGKQLRHGLSSLLSLLLRTALSLLKGVFGLVQRLVSNGHSPKT